MDEDLRPRHNPENNIAQYLRLALSVSSDEQQEFFQYQLDHLQQITLSPIPKKYRRYINSHCTPKGCWNNSLKLSLKYPEVEYCEGWILVHGIPIEHAFNKIGDQYFDPTIMRENFEYYLVQVLNFEDLKPIAGHRLLEISTPFKIWFHEHRAEL